jgi:glycosyltransferase involved in cell wall biosynthesis
LNYRPHIVVDMTAALRERAGIPQVARQTAWILSQWQEADISALFLSIHERSEADRFSKRKKPPLSTMEDAEYLADALGNTSQAGSETLRFLRRGLRAAVGTSHPLIPIEPGIFTDVIWESYFGPSLPPRCRSFLAQLKLFRSSLTRAEVLTRLRWRMPLAKLKTPGVDFVIFQNPTPIRVSPGTIKIVRLHDLVPLLRFDTQPQISYLMQDFYQALSACIKDSIFVCVSESTRDELVSLFPKAKPKTFVIPNSVALPTFREKPNREAPRDPYFLAVGTIEPRKNYRRLLEAFRSYHLVHRGSCRLVIVGHPGWHNQLELDELKKAKKEGWLTWFKEASPDELTDLYRNAYALLSTSVHEGFGIPPIEAAAFGTPGVLSSLPVFRSHFGEAAEYFDPYDSIAITEALLRMTSARRAQLVDQVREKAAKFEMHQELGHWQTLFAELALDKNGQTRRRPSKALTPGYVPENSLG